MSHLHLVAADLWPWTVLGYGVRSYVCIGKVGTFFAPLNQEVLQSIVKSQLCVLYCCFWCCQRCSGAVNKTNDNIPNSSATKLILAVKLYHTVGHPQKQDLGRKEMLRRNSKCRRACLSSSSIASWRPLFPGLLFIRAPAP